VRIATLDGIQPSALKDLNEVMGKVLAGGEKMRLKLDSPLRSGDALLESLGVALDRSSRVLDDDYRSVQDLDRQIEQAGRDLKERAYRPLTEIYELFPACELRARTFFEKHGGVKSLAFGRNDEPLREAFQKEVLGDLEAKYRVVVGRTIDWIVKEEIALYERSAAYLKERVKPLAEGRALPGEPARFEYRREQVFRAIVDAFGRESATLDLPGAFVEVARRVRDGRFEARPLHLGMNQGVVGFVWNPALEGRAPEAVRQELRDTEARIRSGELVVPRGDF